MKIGIRAGTSVIEIIATPTSAKLLVNASGWNIFPSRPAQREHRQEREEHDQDREEDRPAHRAAGGDDDLGRVAA